MSLKKTGVRISSVGSVVFATREHVIKIRISCASFCCRPIEAARERLLYGVYLQLLLAGDGA
jgi:hypothetical protein